jgi:hypothetical protein
MTVSADIRRLEPNLRSACTHSVLTVTTRPASMPVRSASLTRFPPKLHYS